MLTLHSSNQLERLADALARELRENPQSPLTPETIVVQSLGARRWLSLALAERLGVAMNIEFPFPAAVVESAFISLASRVPVSPIFRRDVLPWRIHARLPDLWEEPGFEGLKTYGSSDPAKLWELSCQIGAVFDRYLAYRPTLLRAWDAGEDDRDHPWESRLWRAITDGEPHPAALAEKVTAAPESANRTLPSRISVFGMSTVPPFYLEVLGEIGRRTNVQLYVLTPTQEYWGDLRSEPEKRRYRRWRELRGKTAGPTQPMEGHPLVASLGKIGREYHEALLDLTPHSETVDFHEPEGQTLLSQLQRAMLHLETPDPEHRSELNPKDRSIQIHNCHSPLRELEVFHDQLLARFHADPTLEPRHVLVSVPDIARYAPYIDAVFGAPESEAARFPYSIADRDARAQNRVSDALLKMLALVGSRYVASEVLSVLDCPPVSEHFALKPDDLPTIRTWVAESGIRWGLDGAHRERLGFPRWEENTWQFGIDRLLLGFALPSTDQDLFEGILPSGDTEGSLAETLGRFTTFTSKLFGRIETMARLSQTAEMWSNSLTALLTEMCASDGDFADEWHDAARVLQMVAEHAALAGHTREIPFEVVRSLVGDALAAADRGKEFLRGGVTFCSLNPMRAVPHRIVALLGMNDDAFPRTSRPPSFDLTALRPQSGDRTTRDDDRYLFLENILSARDVLYLSHSGQSAKDDSKSPPSVLVVELLDYLESVWSSPDDRSLRDHLTVLHPLQPFHRSYFASDDPRLFSYSREAANAAIAASAPRVELSAFLGESTLTAPEGGDITLDQLASFFAHPAKHFAETVLAMRLPFEEAKPEDSEPMTLDHLQAYNLKQELTDVALEGSDPASRFPVLLADGQLPHGFQGEVTLAGAADAARALAQTVADQAPGAVLPDRRAEVTIGPWRIRGHIRGQRGNSLVRARAAGIKGKDLLRAWISHLFACAAEPDSQFETLVVGSGESERLMPPESPRAFLQPLLQIYALAHSRPLPFFPGPSLAFAETHARKGKTIEDARAAGLKEWDGGDFATKEGQDKWNQLIWRLPAEPLGEEWVRLALDVCGPLVAHQWRKEK